MDWSQIWSVAAAAGVVSAVVSAIANGGFALYRHGAEVKARRDDSRLDHLRGAAADFLATETTVFAHGTRMRDEIDAFLAHGDF